METAVKLENITKRFLSTSGTKYSEALTDISFEIAKGSLTIVAGANGSGKSVLMNLISALMKPSEGKITVSSKPGLVFQEASTQILGDTPREDVAVGLKNLKTPKKEIPALVEDALKNVRLLEKADFPAEFLSGGEKRRLAVASILAMRRDIIIFDEPYANLDYPAVVDVNNLLAQLHSEGKTVILLTHELEKCLALADHFLILQKGKLVYDGTPEEAVKLPLEQWSIRKPLAKYESVKDLVWR
jgi:biotin transport system ATP-binding protein